MITRLIWTIWTPVSSVPKKADKFNLSLPQKTTDLIIYPCKLSPTDASWGMSVIHRAAAVGNTSILEILMNADPSSDLNRGVAANNLAPIHLAAWEGHTHMVSYLAANGANVNVTDARERTPMHLAAETGSRDVAQILVVKGAKVKKRVLTIDFM